MNIGDITDGLAREDVDAKKRKFSGQVRVTLTYTDGGIRKAEKEIAGPLLPGRQVENQPLAYDVPGRNFDRH